MFDVCVGICLYVYNVFIKEGGGVPIELCVKDVLGDYGGSKECYYVIQYGNTHLIGHV